MTLLWGRASFAPAVECRQTGLDSVSVKYGFVYMYFLTKIAKIKENERVVLISLAVATAL